MSGAGERGVNTVHRTEGGSVRPVHGVFQLSMVRRCFNHDYRDPFFYMVTITTHRRRPWFGVCENNACALSADRLLVRDLWHRGSLRAYTRYILDNPRRYCLKKAHPELFRTVTGLRHPALPPGQSWDGYGNRFLLDRPEKLAISVSRKATEGEIAALREETLAEAAQGTVIVSPFISPGERDIATAILAAPAGDVILLKPGGFPPLFKPNGRYFDLCVQGRLLILSRTVVAVHGDTSLTRETCLALNAACVHLAEALTTEDTL